MPPISLCGAFVQNADTQSLGNAVNRNNTRTIGKHGEIVEKPLYKCISEGLMHVAAWYHGTAGSIFTKFGEMRPITLANFVALRQKV